MSRLLQERNKKTKNQPEQYKLNLATLIQHQASLLSQRQSIQIQQQNQTIHSLRQENLNLKQQIDQLMHKISKDTNKRNGKITNGQLYGKQINNKMQVVELQNEQDDLQRVVQLLSKLQASFNEHLVQQLHPFTKIVSNFLNILKQDPQLNTQLSFALAKIQTNITKLAENTLQEQFIKRLTEFKEALKKQREQIKQSLEQTINNKIKAFQEKDQKMIENEQQIIKNIPIWIKQLKEAIRKKEQDHKRQISLLQQQIITISERNKQTIQSQNKLIQHLKQSLQSLKLTYDQEIQIPIMRIRESVQAQIDKMKSKLLNTQQNTSIIDLVKDLVTTLTHFTESKQQTNYNQMHQQIKKISKHLSQVNDHSFTAIAEIKQMVLKNGKERMNFHLVDCLKKGQDLINTKKKEKQQLELQVKYYKQKEYIQILQKYNKKLEQSVMRTQKDTEKGLYSDWKQLENNYKSKEKEFDTRMISFDQQISKAMTEIIEIKKTAFSILQNQKSLTSSLESFQTQIAVLKQFKEELFKFLQNELKFILDINGQIQIFNQVFVRQYNQLTNIKSTLPPTQNNQSMFHPQFQLLWQSLQSSMNNFNTFKENYEAVFKSKSMSDFKIIKYLNLIAQFHEDYCSKSKRKGQQSIKIQMNFQPIKNHINNAINQIEHFIGNTKIIKQTLLKDIDTIKQQFHQTQQSFQQINKFVRQSKLQPTINSIFEVVESKRGILEEVKLVLTQLGHLSENVGEKSKQQGF